MWFCDTWPVVFDCQTKILQQLTAFRPPCRLVHTAYFAPLVSANSKYFLLTWVHTFFAWDFSTPLRRAVPGLPVMDEVHDLITMRVQAYCFELPSAPKRSTYLYWGYWQIIITSYLFCKSNTEYYPALQGYSTLDKFLKRYTRQCITMTSLWDKTQAIQSIHKMNNSFYLNQSVHHLLPTLTLADIVGDICNDNNARSSCRFIGCSGPTSCDHWQAFMFNKTGYRKASSEPAQSMSMSLSSAMARAPLTLVL